MEQQRSIRRAGGRLAALTIGAFLALPLVACGGDGGGNGGTDPEVGNLSGTVQDESAAGVQNAEVEVSRTGATTRTATTGSDGTFSFTGLETGTWQVDVTPPEGFEPAPNQSLPVSANVQADQTTSVTVNLRLKGGAVQGVVQDGNGDPVSGAEMTLTLPDGSTTTTTSGSNGAYSFTGLDPGDYTVTIDPPLGYEVASGQPVEQSVTVETGSSATADFQVQPAAGTGSVAGSVLNGSMPIADATVSVTLSDGSERTDQTADDGSYVLPALPADDYTVMLQTTGNTALAANEQGDKAVTVNTDQQTTVNYEVVHVVELIDFEFTISSLTVQTGSTVRWVNTTNTFHTVTPDGHGEWSRTETASPETVLEVTFDTAGTFPYFCEPHRDVGMEGEVVVQ